MIVGLHLFASMQFCYCRVLYYKIMWNGAVYSFIGSLLLQLTTMMKLHVWQKWSCSVRCFQSNPDCLRTSLLSRCLFWIAAPIIQFLKQLQPWEMEVLVYLLVSMVSTWKAILAEINVFKCIKWCCPKCRMKTKLELLHVLVRKYWVGHCKMEVSWMLLLLQETKILQLAIHTMLRLMC